MRIAARHADIWNNLAVHQGELGGKIEALRRALRRGRPRLRRRSRSRSSASWSSPRRGRRAAPRSSKAGKIYGGHMGAGLERTASGAPPSA